MYQRICVCTFKEPIVVLNQIFIGTGQKQIAVLQQSSTTHTHIFLCLKQRQRAWGVALSLFNQQSSFFFCFWLHKIVHRSSSKIWTCKHHCWTCLKSRRVCLSYNILMPKHFNRTTNLNETWYLVSTFCCINMKYKDLTCISDENNISVDIKKKVCICFLVFGMRQRGMGRLIWAYLKSQRTHANVVTTDRNWAKVVPKLPFPGFSTSKEAAQTLWCSRMIALTQEQVKSIKLSHNRSEVTWLLSLRMNLWWLTMDMLESLILLCKSKGTYRVLESTSIRTAIEQKLT